MRNDIVNFKGMGNGVRIWLDKSAYLGDILEELEERILENKAFFGDGNCEISIFGRHLAGADKIRLEEVINRLLPLGRISYETDKHSSNDWIVENKHRNDVNHGEHPAAEVISNDENEHKERVSESEYEGSRVVTEEEFLSVFRSNRARLYQGIVEEGQTMRSDGHLVLFGKVEKGGSLIAVGNILVIGGLYGSAHAGCNGHNGSYIFAVDMKPSELSIADVTEEYSYESVSQEVRKPENEKHGFFDKFKKKNEMLQKTDEDGKNITHSAVALWKNHKIKLDNFTIKIFTNPKNVI